METMEKKNIFVEMMEKGTTHWRMFLQKLDGITQKKSASTRYESGRNILKSGKYILCDAEEEKGTLIECRQLKE